MIIEIQKPNSLANNIRHSIVSGISSKGRIAKCVTNKAHDELMMVFVMDSEDGVQDVLDSIGRAVSFYPFKKKEVTTDDKNNVVTLNIKGARQ